MWGVRLAREHFKGLRRCSESGKRRLFATRSIPPFDVFLVPRCFLTNQAPKLQLLNLETNKKRAHFNTKVDEDDDDDDVIRIIYYYNTEKINPFSLAASMPIYDHLSCTALQINARTFVNFPVI